MNARQRFQAVMDFQPFDRLRAVDRDRLSPRGWSRWGEMQSRGEAVLWYTIDGFFWFPRTLPGIERRPYAFCDQPELMHRINTDLADFH